MLNHKLRLKNKYIVVAAIILMAAVGWAKASGGDYLYSQAESAVDDDPARALALFDKLIHEYSSHAKVPDALYWSASLFSHQQHSQATFFTSHSSMSRIAGPPVDLPEGALTREERLWRLYEEYPDHWSQRHLPFLLGEILHQRGEPEAETFFLQALRQDGSRRADAALKLVTMYLTRGQFAEALAIVDYSQKEIPNHLPEEMQLTRGDVLKAMGEREQAAAAYTQVLDILETRLGKDRPGQDDMDMTYTRQHYEAIVSARLAALAAEDPSTAVGTIAGAVRLDGKPLSSVRVLLREMDYRTWSTQEDGLSTVTDAQGAFSFQAAVDRDYEVGIRLQHDVLFEVEGYHLQIINGEFRLAQDIPAEVEFRFVPPVTAWAEPQEESILPLTVVWEPYPDAASYSILLQPVTYTERGYSQTGGAYFTGLTDTEYRVTDIPLPPFGAYSGDEQGVLPSQFVGYLAAADDLSFNVRAHGEQGQVLASSNALFFGDGLHPETLVSLAGRERGPIEELLVQREYDKAVAQLEQRLSDNSEDEFALRTLARIYFSGTHNIGPDPFAEEMAHQDRAKSQELLERLDALNPSQENLRSLAVIYSSLNEVEKEMAAYRESIERGYSDWIAFANLAHYALHHDDDYQQAIEYYDQAEHILRDSVSQERFRYSPHVSVALAIMTGQIEAAQELLAGPFAVTSRAAAVELARALPRYQESSWSDRQEDYLPAISASFAEAQRLWAASDEPHPAFLAVLARLADREYFHQQDALQEKLGDFESRFAEEAPVLQQVLRSLADMIGLK